MNPNDNRAVSALFRVFGVAEPSVVAEAHDFATRRGMHRHEFRVLATLVPLTALLAAGDWLAGRLGPVVGILLAFPVTFFALGILPFLFTARSEIMQWRMWFASCLGWSIYRHDAGGIVGLICYVWIAMGVMSLAAVVVLAWQASMRWSGKPGVAWRMFLLVSAHLAAVGIGFKFGWPWAIGCGAVIAAFFCWAVLNPYSQILGPIYQTTDFEVPLITIDDGPDPHDTPILLDLLDRYQIHAIFFMIGEKVRAHPELAREVISRGHEIGNHTLTHPQASFWCAGPWRTRREIAGCQQVMKEVIGIKPRWFRAPVGHRNFFTHPVAAALGLRVMAWNRRGFDAVEKDAEKVLARILPDLSPGDIVLLHESTPIAAELLGGVLEKASSISPPSVGDGKAAKPGLDRPRRPA
jgi:peptidoglycan/xylan/chitin deacetylase (PgdA/CDA1 family)